MTARSAELIVNARSEGKLGVICSRLSIISYRERLVRDPRLQGTGFVQLAKSIRRRISVQLCANGDFFSWRIDGWTVGRGDYRRHWVFGRGAQLRNRRSGKTRLRFVRSMQHWHAMQKISHPPISASSRKLSTPALKIYRIGCAGPPTAISASPAPGVRTDFIRARPAVRGRPTPSAQRRNVFGGERRDSLLRDGCVEGSDFGGQTRGKWRCS